MMSYWLRDMTFLSWVIPEQVAECNLLLIYLIISCSFNAPSSKVKHNIESLPSRLIEDFYLKVHKKNN